MATLTKNASVEKEVKKFIERLSKRNPNETEFIQAVEEVVESILPFIKNHKKYSDPFILDRLCEPERVIMFNIPWLDDKGNYRLNRGYRVQMNSAIGPYKGGLRFHPSVNLSILKFLAFEQVFKNSLTTLPLGGAKGGADFDPKGKTDNEIMKFCQSYMTEMYRYIGADVDIPAGDIGVNEKEIGYMFGQYKRLKTQFNGVITGKGLSFGGSPLRPEATGYGTVYFAREMLKKQGEKLDGKTAVISGAGNVALNWVFKRLY
jgi:glutamate dehydrogenase (NADP+)